MRKEGQIWTRLMKRPQSENNARMKYITVAVVQIRMAMFAVFRAQKQTIISFVCV